MRLSLNQALILTVVATLLPISAFSVYQGFANRDYAEQLVKEQLVTNALATAADQRDPINTAQRMMAVLAQDRDVLAMSEKCGSVLKKSLDTQSPIVNFVREDADGNARCSVLPMARKFNFRAEPWWAPGVAARRFTVSTPVMGPVSQRNVLIGMHPIYDAEGRFQGAITAGIEVAKMEDALRRQHLSSSAVALIVDASGRPLIASNAATFPPFAVEKSFAAVNTLVGSDGRRWLYSSAPLFEKQMFVVYAEPQATLLSPITDNLRLTLVLAVLAILLTSLAVWAGVNRLVIRWLRETGNLARQFAQGGAAFDQKRFAAAPREIASLGNDLHGMATTIADRTHALATAAESNRLMAREVNHRVKNNLQMIISLLELQTAKVRDDPVKAVLQQTRMRMSALALIYRLHYDEATEESRAEQGLMDIDRLLSELCRQLRISVGFGKFVTLSYEGIRLQLMIDNAIPMALLVVEAVSNALRHGFVDRARGKVLVRLSRSGASMQLAVTDDGVGFDTTARREAIGIELMQAFATQLNGTVSIQSTIGSGSRVLLSFAE